MSEFINNKEERQNALKGIIKELHAGATVEEVKAKFEKLIEGVSATEITEMEQALVNEGMPVSEIQNLCDVHASVFKGSIEEIHEIKAPGFEEGHPIHTFKLENKAIENLIDQEILPTLELLIASEDKNKKEILILTWKSYLQLIDIIQEKKT